MHYDLLAGAATRLRLTDQNAAGYAAVLAPEMIALAQAPQVAPALVAYPGNDWPTQLNGVKIDVTDAKGQHRSAPIYLHRADRGGLSGSSRDSARNRPNHFDYVHGSDIRGPGHRESHLARIVTADATGSGAPAGYLGPRLGERRDRPTTTSST